MKRISNITVLLGDTSNSYSLGRHFKEITYIWSDPDHIYQVFGHDGSVDVEIVNCPVIVEFIE